MGKDQDQNPQGNHPQKAGKNHDANKKMDIDPNMGGPFAYSENQENESIHTIPDDSLNPESRGAEGPADEQDSESR
jgi:hypothetical protein